MTRLDDLRAKLKARRNKPGFEENVRAIEAAIAREEVRRSAADE